MTIIIIMNSVCFKVIQAMFMVLLMLQVYLICAQEVRCIEREREALLNFKASLMDDNVMLCLSSWGAEEDKRECCQWKGVGCSNQTSHVEILDIGYCHLRGKIHTSLMELQHLKYLNLSFNYFYDTHIPDFFSSLSSLRYLDLSSSSFGGKIPSHFGCLSHLEYLNLGNNQLEGSIPYQLGNLSSLQYLDIRDNFLEGRLPSQLGSLSKLQYIDLSQNDLEGTLPSQLGKLSSLQKLLLGYNFALKFDNRNHIGGQWLSNLTSLTHLDLSRISNLNDSGSLQMIAKLPKLTELVLSDCSLSDNFLLSQDPSKVKFSTSLVVLDLSWNTFTPSIMFQRVSNICTLRSLSMIHSNLIEDLSTNVHRLSAGCIRYSLQELYLSNNQITGTLPNLSIFPSLKTLDLQENRLTGKIPETIKLPSQFESLNVDFNSLEGGIPKSFGNVCTLRSLSLSNNSLSEEFPVIIHHLSGCAKYSLQELYLGMNQIIGTLPDLSTFTSLKGLFLNENRLDGKVPENIRFPSQLEALHMKSNSLKGVITDSHFDNLYKLKWLDLSDNSLALTFSQNWVPSFQLDQIFFRSCILGPTFPRWLHTQINFLELDISNAGISDIVPEWFWTLSTKLLSMNISYNNLMGTIPNFPLRFTRYPTITLAMNQFEGPIPSFLRSVRSLDLSRNKFSASFLFLCSNDTSAKLGQLDLSNNRLSGEIPDCWSHFKSLAYLDLSHNNYSGTIPTSMGSLLELQALILRNNSLTEEIPFSLSNCTKLVLLDAGENRLSGPIPSWIGSMLQELQMLSLRRNHFFGSLPLHLCHLKSIQLLDLSLNKLSGRIPTCIMNLTSMAQMTHSVDSPYHVFLVNISSKFTYASTYDLYALLMWKGTERMFKNNGLLLKSIDLSSNQLSEEIPAEIENLVDLVSLNLSRNNLTGEIPLKIGRLTSLEFLDLSRNQLVGSIPSSLIQIDRLTMLDLSHNYLSGEIPISTQLQSFDASSYENNLNLCGRPLQKMCKDKEPSQQPTTKFCEDEDSFLGLGFYLSMAFGFVTGFWGIFGSIVVKRSWRHAYFRFLNNLMDPIYVMIAVKVAKYKRWVKG